MAPDEVCNVVNQLVNTYGLTTGLMLALAYAICFMAAPKLLPYVRGILYAIPKHEKPAAGTPNAAVPTPEIVPVRPTPPTDEDVALTVLKRIAQAKFPALAAGEALLRHAAEQDFAERARKRDEATKQVQVPTPAA